MTPSPNRGSSGHKSVFVSVELHSETQCQFRDCGTGSPVFRLTHSQFFFRFARSLPQIHRHSYSAQISSDKGTAIFCETEAVDIFLLVNVL